MIMNLGESTGRKIVYSHDYRRDRETVLYYLLEKIGRHSIVENTILYYKTTVFVFLTEAHLASRALSWIFLIKAHFQSLSSSPSL